jgi:DNA-binding protein YbaB
MSQPSDPTAGIPDLIGLVDMQAEMERISKATFTGRDPDNFVTAVVDGDGIVVRITFGSTIGGRAPAAVENAILAAVAAAQERTEEEWQRLADRLSPTPTESTAADANDGGLELAYDPGTEEAPDAR